MKKTIAVLLIVAACGMIPLYGESIFSSHPVIQQLQARIITLSETGRQNVDDRIILSFGFATNRSEELIIPKEEYFCRLSLTNQEGQVVAKTRLGKEFGSKFDQLPEFSLDLIDKKSKGRPRIYTATQGFMEKLFLLHDGKQVTLNDLFEIPKDGIYGCRIEFQAFKRLRDGSGGFTVVKFPPIEFPVEKVNSPNNK